MHGLYSIFLSEGNLLAVNRYQDKVQLRWTVEKLKVRLVVFGNHHVESINCTQILALVAKMVIVLVFFTTYASKKLELHQMDIHNAFLHGDLDVNVYIKLHNIMILNLCIQVWFVNFASLYMAYDGHLVGLINLLQS